jgi:hypothetical protein
VNFASTNGTEPAVRDQLLQNPMYASLLNVDRNAQLTAAEVAVGQKARAGQLAQLTPAEINNLKSRLWKLLFADH